MTPRFLIISHTHHLLPWAWRLRKEGAQVELVVAVKKYHRAWKGLLAKELHPKGSRLTAKEFLESDQWKEWKEAAEAGDLTILTDWEQLSRELEGVPNLYAKRGVARTDKGLPPLFLGGWIGPTGLAMPHLFVPDWGAWPGGGGMPVEGAGTLVRGAPSELLAEPAVTLFNEGFRGLFRMGIQFDNLTREFQVQSVEPGWPFLHTHLFFSEIEQLLVLFLGDPQAISLPKPYVCGIPVTVPPWPLHGNMIEGKGSGTQPIGGLPKEVRTNFFFHDMQKDDEKVTLADLDGLVGVAQGSGLLPSGAKMKACAVAQTIQVPGKQWRGDVGGRVEALVMGLEEMGWVLG